MPVTTQAAAPYPESDRTDMDALRVVIRDVEESLATAVEVANSSSVASERLEAIASARTATEALQQMMAVTDAAEGRRALSQTLTRVNAVLQVSHATVRCPELPAVPSLLAPAGRS